RLRHRRSRRAGGHRPAPAGPDSHARDFCGRDFRGPEIRKAHRAPHDEEVMRQSYVRAAFSLALAVLCARTARQLSADVNPAFDGSRAYEHVRHLVEIGPRPPDSDGIRRTQAYIIGQLKSYGCPVEEHDNEGLRSANADRKSTV